MKRRCFHDIIASALEACLRPATKTEVVYRTLTNWKRGSKFLPKLVEAGLLSKEAGKYVITEKGRKYLEAYAKLKEMLG